jgi:hypothetical protein
VKVLEKIKHLPPPPPKKKVEQKNLAYKKYLQRPGTMRFSTSVEKPLPKEKLEKEIANPMNNYHHS